jgi:hypothetical protein
MAQEVAEVDVRDLDILAIYPVDAHCHASKIEKTASKISNPSIR